MTRGDGGTLPSGDRGPIKRSGNLTDFATRLLGLRPSWKSRRTDQAGTKPSIACPIVDWASRLILMRFLRARTTAIEAV